LGVRPDASSDEIKSAWRDAAERFEPGSGGGSAQFRLFNEAAEVLLDPERRRTYDEGLAADTRTSLTPPPSPPAASGPVTSVGGATDLPVTHQDPKVDRERTRGASLPVLLGLALVAILLVVAAAVYGVPKLNAVRDADGVDASTRTAPAIAERAAVAILSYDYTSLPKNEAAAEGFMTASYRKQYASTFDALVTPHAVTLHAKVTASVKASGVTNADSNRADVLMFVNQTTTSTANRQAQKALNRVSFEMVKQNGTWLVNDITSY
jgi:Mce-associated membrane protein